jgi:hypothetical protein
VAQFATRELKLSVKGVTKSSPRGPKGNEEFFLLLQKDFKGELPPDWEEMVERALKEEIKSEVS